MLRLPKTVNISGKIYKVVKNKKRWGGVGKKGKQEIGVGTAGSQSVARKFENFMHEVTELVACERHFRYEASDEEIMFVMNHKQFDAFSNDISIAIWPMIRK